MHLAALDLIRPICPICPIRFGTDVNRRALPVRPALASSGWMVPQGRLGRS